MLAEGSDAPTFTLPGIVDGAPRDVDISDYVGGGILIIVFYPGDFNPSCEEDSCDLTELDPLTMQQDVDVFAISPDSVFSHRAFAEEYSLSIPLLADTHGDAMDAYDVRYEKSDQLLAKRAVFVIDQRGVVQYAWDTDDMEERPEVDAVREAISDIGGDSTALGRYRVGHAHYMEGRRAFTSAMNSYEDRDWLISQGDFERAMEEFQESSDHFQSAVRFAESGPLREGFERAQEKATALWQAAEWLADSANAYASGNGKRADDYRQDAESPLKNARDIGEPPDPDDIDLDAAAAAEAAAKGDDAEDLEAPTDPNEDENTSEPGGETEAEPDDEDIDAAVQELEAEDDEIAAATDGDEQDTGSGETPGAPDAAGAAEGATEEPDEEEIDAIAEELEAQNRRAQQQAETDAETDEEESATGDAVPEHPPGQDSHQQSEAPDTAGESTAESNSAEHGVPGQEAQSESDPAARAESDGDASGAASVEGVPAVEEPGEVPSGADSDHQPEGWDAGGGGGRGERIDGTTDGSSHEGDPTAGDGVTDDGSDDSDEEDEEVSLDLTDPNE
jgi:peroxiredoxin